MNDIINIYLVKNYDKLLNLFCISYSIVEVENLQNQQPDHSELVKILEFKKGSDQYFKIDIFAF